MTAPKLRITIMGLNYAPEPTGIAPYTTRLAEGLEKAGHDVLVLTGYPHYPHWKLQPGYSGWRLNEVQGGVRIRRLRQSIPARVTALTRIHMELSFGIRLFLAHWGKPDVVIAVTPSLFSTGLVTARIRLTRNKPGFGVWVQDIYSRGLEETGTGDSTSVRMMKHLEGQILRSADRVSVIHDRFKDYLSKELRVSPDKIQVIRNWNHTKGTVHNRAHVESRTRHGWGPDDIIVLHAGNMGVKQGLDNVVQAARIAEQRGSRVKFVLLGDGNQRHILQTKAQGLKNIQFIPPVPDDEFDEILASADLLLVNELPGLREMAVPSKLTSYFGAGVPVVAATDADSTTAGEIRTSQGGILVRPGKPNELIEAVESLHSDEKLALSLGQAGRQYANNVLSENAAIDFYKDWVEDIAGSRDARFRSTYKLNRTT